MFRVFDNEGETVDRYTIFLANDPDLGSLGVSEDPDHPQGFSQWGDFDVDQVEATNTAISFDDLPDNVQDHVVDRFELTETDEDLMGVIILSMMHGEIDEAKGLVSELISEKVFRRVQGLNELKLGAVKFVGDDVIINGKKVGSIENDLEDFDRGIVLKLDSGEEEDFDKVEDLIKHLFDVFRIKESTEVVMEATSDQKAVVKGLRQLAKQLDIPKPRFRSLNGRAGFVEMAPKNWKEDVIPNGLREKIVTKIFRTVPQNFSDVNHGNVRKDGVALTAEQWKEVLYYYGIDLPEEVMEGFQVLPRIDTDRYQERQGLEGPFRARNGKVVYYDPKEGKYYDPDSDFYISFDEWEEMDRDPRLRRS